MSYFDMFKTRMNAIGVSVSDEYTNETTAFINANFKDSPTYKQIMINASTDLIDARIINTSYADKEYGTEKLLLKPNQTIELGDLITVGDKKYIVIDVDINIPVYPKATIKLCNSEMKWKDKISLLQNLPCIVSNKNSLLSEDKYFLLPDGNINVVVQFNALSNTIIRQLRFVFAGEVYEVIGIDRLTDVYKEHGFTSIKMKSVTVKPTEKAKDIGDNTAIWAGGASVWSS